MGSHASSRPSADAAHVLDALRRIVRFLRVPSEGRGASASLTTAQYFVLTQLSEASAASIRLLAERTMTDPSSVSVVVSKLEALGLVSRSPDPDDRRRAVLALTARGRKALSRAPELPQARIVAALDVMPAARRRTVVAGLDALVVALGADGTAPPMFFEEAPKARRARRAKPRR